MDPIRFVEKHGVVLEGGRGPRLSLAEAVAGERINGSWWRHKKARAIFRATRAVRDCNEVLVCRLAGGKITYVHRRLWPAIVRLAKLWTRRLLQHYARNIRGWGHTKFAQSHFHGGFHRMSVRQLRTSLTSRPVFDWVTGLGCICADSPHALLELRSLGDAVLLHSRRQFTFQQRRFNESVTCTLPRARLAGRGPLVRPGVADHLCLTTRRWSGYLLETLA